MTRWLRVAACWVTIAACMPYLVLKGVWLSGTSVGAASTAGAASLVDTRHIVGDVVTAAMELAAIFLVLALTCPWGRRLPAVAVLVPVWAGTGLLAPIAVGLPLGLVAQAFAGGSAAPTDNGLQPWVYAVVYGGFIVQAVGLLVAFACHLRDRWPKLFRIRMAQLRVAGPGLRRWAMAAAVIAAGYSVMLAAWSVTGTRWGGPAGFDTPAQKTYLFMTGALVLAGAGAVLSRRGSGPILPLLALAWIGAGVTVTSGAADVALSSNSTAGAVLVAVSLAGTVSGLLLARSALRMLPPGPRLPDSGRSKESWHCQPQR